MGSNRFNGLLQMIVLMDLELYYRITAMSTRTSKYVLKLLERTEVNYKIHEAGVFNKLDKNLKKWLDLLAVSRDLLVSKNQGEEIIARIMRYMPPGFFDRLLKYYE